MLNHSASLAMPTSILKALPGKLDIKRHSPSILYILASLTMSTCVLRALPGKLDIKRHLPSILYIPVLTSAVYYLATHPDVDQKLQEEFKNVLWDQNVNATNIDKLV